MRITEPALAEAFGRRRAEIDALALERRLRAEDPTLWPAAAADIQARLGWVTLPARAEQLWRTCQAEADRLRDRGITRAILVGIGGSSLGAQLLDAALRPGVKALRLDVLDSTLPGALRGLCADWDPERTAIVAASKSGGTLEMSAGLAFLRSAMAKAIGASASDGQVLVITDPGSGLDQEAEARGWARIHGDPRVGGRFSLLSAFGLLPAALRDLDLGGALALAASAAEGPWTEAMDLAAVLAAAQDLGRDQLALRLDGLPAAYGAWLEQLVAESSGKGGKGLLPITVGQLGSRCAGGRCLAVRLVASDARAEAARDPALAGPDLPVVVQELSGAAALPTACFQWELATAALGALLGLNPFDQPDVEAAKQAARSLLAEGAPEAPDPSQSDWPAPETLDATLADADYVALLAYLPERPAELTAIARLAAVLGERYGRSIVAAIGPRYLHSTGQLFKGDAGRGAFLILDGSAVEPDLAMAPGSGVAAGPGFGRVAGAQAAGDAQALRAGGRKVLLTRLAPDWQASLATWLDHLIAAT